MTAILISIKPKYIEKILSGEKTYEYRRKMARKKPSIMIIYCTAPVSKVIAYTKIISQLSASPDALWNMTKSGAGISYDEYMRYFSNSKIAYAYEIGEVIKFNCPRELLDYGIDHAPQSFIYINTDHEICVPDCDRL